jgi:hypothetical protein
MLSRLPTPDGTCRMGHTGTGASFSLPAIPRGSRGPCRPGGWNRGIWGSLGILGIILGILGPKERGTSGSGRLEAPYPILLKAERLLPCSFLPRRSGVGPPAPTSKREKSTPSERSYPISHHQFRRVRKESARCSQQPQDLKAMEVQRQERKAPSLTSERRRPASTIPHKRIFRCFIFYSIATEQQYSSFCTLLSLR